MRRFTVLLGLIAAAVAGGLVAREAGIEASFEAVRRAMADRDFPGAERLALEFARDHAGTPRAEEAEVLALRARLALARHDDAVRLALGFLETYAESPWREKVRFLLADAHARAKGFEKAVDIYRDRVETLAADDHQAKIAGDYLAIATKAYEGVEREDRFGRKTLVKDHKRALQFFLKARGIHVDPATRDELRHRIADCHFHVNQLDKAVAEWTALLEEDEKSRLRAEATYRIGEALLKLGRPEEARRRLREVVDDHQDSPRVPEAIVLLGQSHDPLRTRDEEAFRLGVGWWQGFTEKYFAHEKAPAVFFDLAVAWKNRGEHEKAIEAWNRFLARFGEHEKAPEAQYRIGEARLARREFDLAIEAWKALLGRWPNHSLWTKAQAMIVEADFQRGEVPFSEKRWDDAVAAWTRFLETHPTAKRAPAVQERLAEVERRREKWDAAIAAWRIVVGKYPKHAEARRSLLAIAQVIETRKGDLEGALKEYEEVVKRYPRTAEARRAQAAIGVMKQKRLEVVTKRAYHTDEKPTLSLKLRNIESLEFRAYRVDLEEYYRRKRVMGHFEDVVVSIVKPDPKWTWKLEGYRPYLPVETEIELPLEGPGAWILTCGEMDLTATTLVVVSDLQVIVKRTAHQIFTCVVDQRTGEPRPGARLIVADGQRVFAEGKTGEDGTWILDDPKKTFRDVRVMAVAEGHTASTGGLAQGGTTWGYSTKAYLYTDRPLYRPGQTIEFRGIVRKVTGGDYDTPVGETVKTWITDARGTVLHEKEIKTSDYGTIAGTLTLPAEARLGDYVLRARYRDVDFQVGFQVMEYRKPEFTADIRTAKPTYLTGETVEATVKLRYTFGGAVAGTPVTYQVLRMPYEFDASALRRFSWFFADPKRAEERRRRAFDRMEPVAEGELTTDEKGVATLSFETEKVEKDRAYVIAVRAQDVNREWISDQRTVYVTQKGHFAVVRTDRKVYRPKEAIRATITTVDARQMPVAAKGEVVALRRQGAGPVLDKVRRDKKVRPGRIVWEPVGRYALETGPDGKGTVSFRVERAGEYRVRWEGVDARGGVVLSAAPFDVSGEAEDLAKQAKIVAEQEIYMEGDTAKVLVNTPFAPALALLTFEGEKVLRHQLLKLESRSTTLSIPMTAEDSPNVFLRLAIPDEGKLHEDEEEVAVLKFLNVAVTTDAAEAKPGDTVKATVEATDQKGRPVAAELSLAVVDGSIFALAPDGTPDIKPFFYDQRRKNAVVTTSSLIWSHAGITRPTNKDLLQEEARRLGADRYRAMQEHVRAGREAFQRGDPDAAVAELRRALEISPGNYEARALLTTMVTRYASTANATKGPTAGGRIADELRKLAGGADAGPDAPTESAPAMEPSADKKFEGKSHGIGGGTGGKRGRRPGARKEKSDATEEMEAEFGAEDDGDAPFDGYFKRGTPARKGAAAPKLRLAILAEGLVAHGRPDGSAIVPATLRKTFADTARWWPSVRTGADGKAEVELKLPDNLTTWRLTARGVSRAALVGESRAALVARQPMLVRIDTPRFLTQGDRTTITSTVHNGTGGDADVRLALTGRNVGLDGATTTSARIADGEVRPFDWKLRADGPGLVKLEARAESTRGSDAVAHGLRSIPFGLPHRDGRSGVVGDAGDAAIEVLERPEDVIPGTMRFVLTISPDVDASLLEGIGYLETFPYGCLEQTVNRFLPAIAAHEALRTLGVPDDALRKRVTEIVDRGLNSLYSFQANNGSFGWWKETGDDPLMTAYAVIALERARLAGFRVNEQNRQRALGAAAALLRKSRDNTRKAFLHYALALGGKADFGGMNSVYRYRDGLDPVGLATLALAFRVSGRSYNAHELVKMLFARAVDANGEAHWSLGRKGGRGSFLRGDVEATSLALLAIVRTEPTSPLADRAARWLQSHRRGAAWGTTKATGFAIQALAAWQQVRKAARHDFVVEVLWNGELYQKVPVRGGKVAARDRVVLLDEARVRTGRNELKLRRVGSGSFRYALSYEYVTPADSIPAAGNLVRVERRWVEYVSPLAAKSGERIPEGYSIVRPEARPKKTEGVSLERAGSGDRFRVVLKLTAREDLDYVIVEDPLPAGVEVLEGQARGPFDHQERRDEKQVFFLSHVKPGTVELSYLCQAVHPGSYRALPTSAYAMYEPEIFGRSADRRLEVATESGLVGRRGDAESLTPDTVFHLAKKDFADERWERARGAFAGLVKDWKLQDGYHEECLWYLMKCAFALKDARGAVEAYEALRERNPRRGVAGRQEKMALAASYDEIREHERALVLYRSLGDELFAQEAEVANTYYGLGDPIRAQAKRAEIVRRYPDSGAVLAAEWAIARAYFDLRRPVPKKGDAPRIGDDPLMLPESLEGYRTFQAHHPTHPEADGANYMALAALQKMKRFDEAVAEAEAFRRRHPSSIRLDKVVYDLCTAYFRKNDFDRARSVAKEILTKQYRWDRRHRRTRPSQYRPNVTFLLGQMAHVEGRYAEAVKHYDAVKGKFADARDALAFFTSTGMRLPESVVFGVEEPASVKVESKNLEELRLKVYEVDLMILFAVRKDLRQINRIDLTGIVPIKEWTVKLDAAKDYRWHEEKVAVPASGKGVFLVVAKGGEHDGSTVVIQSDLEIKIQPVEDRVRVYAFHRKTREPMRDVYVKIGDGSVIRAQGLTDARGVFEARGVRGQASVVAEKDGHYALSR